MRFKPLKSLRLILSLSKDEARIPTFFSILLSKHFLALIRASGAFVCACFADRMFIFMLSALFFTIEAYRLSDLREPGQVFGIGGGEPRKRLADRAHLIHAFRASRGRGVALSEKLETVGHAGIAG